MNRSAARAVTAAQRRTRKLVLVVDDIADQRELYAGYLRYLGYAVEEAADGASGIAKAVDLLPNVLVLDLSMPGLDGFATARVLKAISVTRGIPILAITAHGDRLPAEWAALAGCEAYCRKPILPHELAAEVDRLLRRTAQ